MTIQKLAHADDPDLLEAEGHELLARAARLRAERKRTIAPPAQGPRLITKKMYIARYGSADGWETALAALPVHRLGRANALDAEELDAFVRSRPPRKRMARTSADSDAPESVYEAMTRAS
jgi:hypothetical protein